MSELIRDKIMGKEIPLSSIEEQLNKAQDLVILVLSVSKAICMYVGCLEYSERALLRIYSLPVCLHMVK